MAWISGLVMERTEWAPGLVTLRFDTPVEVEPGQFVNLGLDVDGQRIKRAYSVASAPGAPLEVYVSCVPGGRLSPRLTALAVGEAAWIDPRPGGFLTLAQVPTTPELWLCATGTGLAPFVAMLRAPLIWQRYERIIVVHGVRTREHLGYRAWLEEQAAEHGSQLRYLPVFSRDTEGVLAGRIPTVIASGALEHEAGLSLDPGRCHVLLCGNPAMITDTLAVLAARGLRQHRKREPGHVSLERYW